MRCLDSLLEECSDVEYWQALHHFSSEESNDEESNEEIEPEEEEHTVRES